MLPTDIDPTRMPTQTGASGLLPTQPANGRAPEWALNRPPTRWPQLNVRELLSYREVAGALALRDLRVRYKQTFFGIAWAVLQPLITVGIFTVVFGRVAHLPTAGTPYPVFVFAGMSVWLYFSAGVNGAAQNLVNNRELVTKVFFPRLLAPIAGVFPPLVDFAISLVILGVFLAAYGIVPGPAVALVPVWVLGSILLALGVGLWLSALNVKYRDVRYVLPFLIQVWFFASPVVYAGSSLSERWQWAFALNPVVPLIDGFRWSLSLGPPPGVEGLISLAVGIVVLGGGLAYFQRLERHFGDLI